MAPWEIVVELVYAPHQTTQAQILSELPADDPFWVGAAYFMNALRGPLVGLKLGDPKKYGRGVPASAFDKLVKAILEGRLAGDDLVIGIEAISRACTEDEWVRWYKPILLGQMRAQVPIRLYNKHAPKERRVPEFLVPELAVIKSLDQVPDECIIQPIPHGEETFWLISEVGSQVAVRGYRYDGTRIVDRPEIEQALRLPGQDGLVIEGVLADRLYVYDLLTKEEFVQRNISAPLSKRLPLIENLVGSIASDSIWGAEHVRVTKATFIDELDLMVSQGFGRCILRNAIAFFHTHKANFLFQPYMSVDLTCTDVIWGDADTKYEKVARTIMGKGVLRKQSVHAEVQLGLTRTERDLFWNNREKLIGATFEVGCCNVAADGELVLPVFRNWKDISWARPSQSTASVENV